MSNTLQYPITLNEMIEGTDLDVWRNSDKERWMRAGFREQWLADGGKRVIEDLIAAFGNDGKTSSLHDWDKRMRSAVASARAWLATADEKAERHANEHPIEAPPMTAIDPRQRRLNRRTP